MHLLFYYNMSTYKKIKCIYSKYLINIYSENNKNWKYTSFYPFSNNQFDIG